MSHIAIRSAFVAAALVLPGVGGKAFAQVDLTAQHVSVPSGLSSNDDVRVDVDGQFPTPCYHEAEGRTEFDPATNVFTLTPRANVDAGICIQMLMPYATTFDLGALPAGHYRIKTPGLEALERLDIAEPQ